ncbi:cryptochrome DASH, chloroplastic/mitochondrial isoform X2 [Lolium perenne]|uniref:cryptochrome DASH, chloroplastic/mitochondrial isoform X2 n=1 Tax=Lolium perenne TaxID=4522 RepID=UPI0021F50F10|nr:cryptochrome DASH, chloroplastic/mitochondrial isoform X2 [Lolium perenne]
MLHLRPSSCSFPPTAQFLLLPRKSGSRFLLAMTYAADSSSSASFRPLRGAVAVPSLGAEETTAAADEAFRRHTSPGLRRAGSGVAVVWFRNDLRVLDNEALARAWAASEAVLPVYCVDPRVLGGATHRFGFPKTGALRAQFLIECLGDLKRNLQKRGLDLLIRHGKPEDVLPSIVKTVSAHTVYAHKETCSEELLVELLVRRGLEQVVIPQVGTPSNQNKPLNPKLQLIWGATMYHIDDLPFPVSNLPDVYTQFRKAVESKSSGRSCSKLPPSLGPAPSSGVAEIGGWGSVPTLESLGLSVTKAEKGMYFIGGESAALGRVHEYFWKNDQLKVYKETRNGMLGPDYSTKFSPWLASGSLSPRYVCEEVKRYEKQRVANDSTYWVLFELIWRDYFRFLSEKYGNSIFHLGGPRKVVSKWSQDQTLFESWRDGRTGYPLIDANMKELLATGFMSNRGRQIVCSFLVRDMGIDWRMGAEWFETCLLDYDPASNYGNWTYGSGVGNDPREDRYFSIPKQAKTYDPDGEYVAYWLPELRSLAREKRNFPGASYIKQIVPLKFDGGNQKRDQRFNRQTRPKNVYRRQK